MNRILSRSPGAAGLATVVLLAATAASAWAHPETGSLPGGTSIEVSIDTPADGAILPPGPVTIDGTAAIGMAETVANTAVVYVLDVSFSATGAQVNCPDPGDHILDCEKASTIALNNQAVALGTVGEAGAVIFAANAASADVQPAAGDQLITGPASDDNTNGVRDIEEVLDSVEESEVNEFTAKSVANGTTNFAAAIEEATAVADAATLDQKVVVFLSDGANNAGGSIGDPGTPGTPLGDVPADVVFHSFAVGASIVVSCDRNPQGLGSLQEIADGTGGTCTNVPDLTTLPDILPEVIASELTSLTLSVNGGPQTPITDVTPPLTQEGPADVEYTVTTDPLPAGTHELCVTATGSDTGGEDSITDCHTVIIDAPPEVDAGGPYAGQEGSPVDIAGTVTDPDSDPAVQWNIEPASAVDAGTTCEFGDATAETTTVTCTDDGTFTLTLTADDGVSSPVSQMATLELTNVAPSVSISAPDDGELFAANTPVEFVAPFTDPGSNDTHTCTVDFDDGTPVADGMVDQSPGSGTCSVTHAFTEVGPHNVLVTVTDDNGGSRTAIVTVVIHLPAEAFAIEANGLVTVPKTPHATCPPDESLTQAQLNVPGLATVDALTADCTVDIETGQTIATASIDQVSLLGGLINITNIESTCQADAGGVTRTSSVGTINGTEIGIGSGSITIPLVATVHFNETTTNAQGQLVQNAIRVQTILGQEIVLAGCRLG